MDPGAASQGRQEPGADAGFDVLIVDTAGRMHVDPEMMKELKQLVDATTPVEVLFVADSMTGQDAVRSAEAFSKVVPLTGHVLTKLDGDARGALRYRLRPQPGALSSSWDRGEAGCPGAFPSRSDGLADFGNG